MKKSRSRKLNQSQSALIIKKKEPYKGILGNGKPANILRLTMWNVNGIRSILSKPYLKKFIAQYNPDFICFNQTKINQQLYVKQKIKIKEYNDYQNFCKCSAGYSGVAVFAKYQPLSIFQDMENPLYSQEGRILTLQYELFYLIVVYMPTAGMKKPGSSQLQRLYYKIKFQNAFQQHCQKIKQKGKGVIVCGDFNTSLQKIDIHEAINTHKQPGYTSQERLNFKKMLQKGWIDIFRRLNPNKRQYTWWRVEHNNRKNIGRRIDYFFVNSYFAEYAKKAEILGQTQGSDHCPILLDLDLSQVNKDKVKETKEYANLSKCVTDVVEARNSQKTVSQYEGSQKYLDNPYAVIQNQQNAGLAIKCARPKKEAISHPAKNQ